MVNNLPAMQETWVQSLGQENPLEKWMGTHSSILAWRIQWTEEPGELQSTGSQRVGHNWATNTHTFSYWVSPLVVSGYLRPHGLYPTRLSVHGILQARILEWVAISFSRGSSQPKDRTWVSHIAGRLFTVCTTGEAHTHRLSEYFQMKDKCTHLPPFSYVLKKPSYNSTSLFCLSSQTDSLTNTLPHLMGSEGPFLCPWEQYQQWGPYQQLLGPYNEKTVAQDSAIRFMLHIFKPQNCPMKHMS